MAATYEPIATTTLGSAAADITFSSIGSGYTDLKIVLVGTTTASANTRIRFNSDTGNNYSRTTLIGNGSSVTSNRSANFSAIAFSANFSTTIPAMVEIDIFSYAGSTNKTALISQSADQNGSGSVVRTVGLWRNTAAISTIDLFVNGSTFAVGTTATLYGILKA